MCGAARTGGSVSSIRRACWTLAIGSTAFTVADAGDAGLVRRAHVGLAVPYAAPSDASAAEAAEAAVGVRGAGKARRRYDAPASLSRCAGRAYRGADAVTARKQCRAIGIRRACGPADPCARPLRHPSLSYNAVDARNDLGPVRQWHGTRVELFEVA